MHYERKDIDIAEEIVVDELAILLNEYATTKDKSESNKLREKIDVMQQIKEEIYAGNQEVVKMIIKKKRIGIL